MPAIELCPSARAGRYTFPETRHEAPRHRNLGHRAAHRHRRVVLGHREGDDRRRHRRCRGGGRIGRITRRFPWLREYRSGRCGVRCRCESSQVAVEVTRFRAGKHERMSGRRWRPKGTGGEAQRGCGAPAGAVRTGPEMGRPGVGLRIGRITRRFPWLREYRSGRCGVRCRCESSQVAVEVTRFRAGKHERMSGRRWRPKGTGGEAQRGCGALAGAVRTASGMGRPGVGLAADGAAVRGCGRCSRCCGRRDG